MTNKCYLETTLAWTSTLPLFGCIQGYLFDIGIQKTFPIRRVVTACSYNGYGLMRILDILMFCAGVQCAMLDPLENGLFDIPDYENIEDEAFPPLPPPASPGGQDENDRDPFENGKASKKNQYEFWKEKI